jgi:hypothetical protein
MPYIEGLRPQMWNEFFIIQLLGWLLVASKFSLCFSGGTSKAFGCCFSSGTSKDQRVFHVSPSSNQRPKAAKSSELKAKTNDSRIERLECMVVYILRDIVVYTATTPTLFNHQSLNQPTQNSELRWNIFWAWKKERVFHNQRANYSSVYLGVWLFTSLHFKTA